jgi:hypothetical protein
MHLNAPARRSATGSGHGAGVAARRVLLVTRTAQVLSSRPSIEALVETNGIRPTIPAQADCGAPVGWSNQAVADSAFSTLFARAPIVRPK